jgi:hypothetical protein
VTLIVEALNLMHPRFAAGGPASFRFELYHQLRHLWDRAVPVQLGLGHILIHTEPDAPEQFFRQLGERGSPDANLGVVAVATLSDADDALIRLARQRRGYPQAVCVVVGRANEVPASGLPEAPGVSTVFFDVEKWRVA